MTDKPMGPVDPLAGEARHPAAERLPAHCDAASRLPSDSTGADQGIAAARRRLPVHHDVARIPVRTPQEDT